MTVLVYKYALRPPTENADLIDEQMFHGHRYYNRLIEIERERRTRVREILSQSHPTIDPLAEQVEELFQEVDLERRAIKQLRAQERRRAESAKARESVRQKQERLKALKKELSFARRALREDKDVQAALHEVQETANTAVRDARARCHCYWGTYLLAEQSIALARKARLWHKGEPNDPRFRYRDHSHSIGIEIMKGAPWVMIKDQRHKQLQFDAEPRETWLHPEGRRREQGLPKMLPTIRMRIGSNRRKPVWGSWPIVYHRPIPPGAVVTWAKVVRERIEAHIGWSLHVTVRIADEPVKNLKRNKIVAINPGWRKKSNGLRVLFWRDSEGNQDEVLLNPKVIWGFDRVSYLQKVRDTMRNEMTDWLLPWLQEAELPEWLAESITTISLWVSQARFAALVLRWRQNRFEGDEDIYMRFEAWRAQDKHLWIMQRRIGRKTERRRREQYRLLGVDLASRYGTLIVDNTKYKDFQRHKKTEDEDIEIAAARLAQRYASPYELRETIVGAFVKARHVVATMPAYLITMVCHHCGQQDKWDRIRELSHTCSSCGRTWDQDDNAVQNLHTQFREWFDGDGNPDTARVRDYGIVRPPKQSKWGKLGRHKKTSRDPDGNPLTTE